MKHHLRVESLTCEIFKTDEPSTETPNTSTETVATLRVVLWTDRRRTNALLQRFNCVADLVMNPVLHGLLPQTEVPQSHQSEAAMLLPALPIIRQNHSYQTAAAQKDEH